GVATDRDETPTGKVLVVLDQLFPVSALVSCYSHLQKPRQPSICRSQALRLWEFQYLTKQAALFPPEGQNNPDYPAYPQRGMLQNLLAHACRTPAQTHLSLHNVRNELYRYLQAV